MAAAASEEEKGRLRRGIAEMYDEASASAELLIGEHFHQGFYDLSAPAGDHRLAQLRTVEEALAFAGITDEPLKKPKKIIDVGCGIGAGSIYLAKKYGAQCQGITLSPRQVERAQALAIAEGLVDKVSFQVADALDQPFPDGQFDLVWSVESAEHMPDKVKFFSELARVAAPGGTIIIVTHCHRDLSPSEDQLQPDEIDLLNKISKTYCLGPWCSASDYVKIAESLSHVDIKTADWTENVVPFGPIMSRSTRSSILTWKGFTTLLGSGWKTIRRLLRLSLFSEGIKKNIVKYVIITCRKPE